MKPVYAVVAGAAVLGMLGGLGMMVLTSGSDDPFAECSSATVAGGAAAIGGPFELVSETGATVTEADVLTQPSIVYFGYTFCPDVCPMDVARNAVATELLEEQGYMVQPVFISIDPERDTPEVVDDFTANMHPRMLGLTGSPEQVKAAAQAYKVYYARQPSEDEYYLVDHSTFSYLVLPEIGFVEYFQRSTTPEEMAATTACYIDAAG